MSNGYVIEDAPPRLQQPSNTVAVYHPRDTGDVIYVQGWPMSFGQMRRVNDAAVKMSLDGGKPGGIILATEFDMMKALVNILGWDGPNLTGKAVTRDNIDNIDNRFMRRVLEEIDRINAEDEDSPNDASAGFDALPDYRTKPAT